MAWSATTTRTWGGLLLGGIVLSGIALATRALQGPPPDPDIIFIVLDTVRARSTSLCGHDRPTTPVLESLRDQGWATTCQAVTPGTWTVPSHASFFTGWRVSDFEGGSRRPTPGETLTGQLTARGYQTAMISANMVLKEPDWIGEGFASVRIARSFAELKGEALAEAVASTLAEQQPDQPLFLFVNVIDAHAPYPAVPEGLDWIPPQRPVQHRMWLKEQQTPFNRYVSGQMSEPEAQRYRRRLVNGYDYGVHLADRSLGRILEALRAADRLHDARVVITSDHGEFVGEHQLVGHGDTLYEPGVRVPLLYHSTHGAAPALPEPLSARHVFELLLDGALPETGPPVSVVTYQPSQRTSYSGVAVWGPHDDKLLWRQGTLQRFDLAADPGEHTPLPVEQHPLRATLEAEVEAHNHAVASTRAPEEETIELLRAAGYVE